MPESKSSNILSENGLFVDDLSQIRVVNPEAADATRKSDLLDHSFLRKKLRNTKDKQR